MKKVIAACSLLICLSACRQEPANPPTVVLDEMFNAMKNGNIEEMKKHITKTDLAILNVGEKYVTSVDSAGIKKIRDVITEEMKEGAKRIDYNIKKETINGNNATVETEIIIKDTSIQGGEKKTIQKFELVKEDNAWKIALYKPENEMFNSMKGNRGPRKGNLKQGVEILQKMDRDTLKMIIRKAGDAVDSFKKKKNTQ